MKVKDLITQLKNYSSDLEVKFVYNYGDYWRTEVAKPVKAVADGHTIYSDYHQMDKTQNDEPNETAEYCVILS